MHLLIDGQALQSSTSRQRGIGRYSSNLLRAIATARPNWRIDVVQNSALPPIAENDVSGLSVLSFQPPLGTELEHRELNERYYADWLTAQGPDAVLLLSHCEGWEAIVPTFCGARPPLFGIAYDLIPLLFPEHYLTDFGTAQWYAHRFRQLLHSDALLAISEATAHDVRTLAGEDAPLIATIGGAVDPLFAPLAPAEFAECAAQVRARFGLHRDFLLYVGAADYRKNLHGAIRAFAALPVACRANLDLALVCRLKPSARAAVEEMAHQAGVASALRLIPSARDDELRALYQMCRLFFFPSLYEGLGLPVLEALHCGAPVVTSHCSALPEYAGPVSWLGDPTSPEAMARVLEAALAEPHEARRNERHEFAHTFRWDCTAERACTIMEQVIRERPAKVARRRRLAWIMPPLPSQTDIANYAAHILPQLAQRFDVEVIAVEGLNELPDEVARDFLLLTPQELLTRHAALPYDLFLYHLTPSPAHPHLLDLLRRFPGLVVLHEFQAADFWQQAERKLLSHMEVLVHSLELWHEARRGLQSPVVYLPLHGEPCHLAAAYAGCLELAIIRRERSDACWRGFAAAALAECVSEPNPLLETWADLRARGQHLLSERQGIAA